MVTLIDGDTDNRFTFALSRKRIELARATVCTITVGKISTFEMPFDVRHCRLPALSASRHKDSALCRPLAIAVKRRL
jgi:hypothetical protein